ncbi:hypothetical protein PFLUV_G00239470 [Perca fluviatilis]|uniref:Uncharacterized protein n=1 Tax=Perca fluviatilis TaxID=8168 RepID=A0A6A5DW58_PERFL|nr:E3 ubiquitin-protein ligase rnf213-beta-like [Perca fluviatilis]KAF1373496.1 hypothetical protein PFLUV_G00239470 [Perca fluviatilis]
MEEGAGRSAARPQNMEDVATKRHRESSKERGPGSGIRKARDKERRKKRNQRRKKSNSKAKGDANVKSEDTEKGEMEVVETTSSQTQESVSIATQHVDPLVEDSLPTVHNSEERRHKDAKMVQAQTQTEKHQGQNKFTQTPVVSQNNQETQTDVPVPKPDHTSDEKTPDETNNAAETQLKQDKHTPEPKMQEDCAVQTPLKQNQDPDKDRVPSDLVKEQNPEKESKSKEENPSAGVSADPAGSKAEKDAKPMSYAKVVTGEGGSQKQSNMEASKAADKTTDTSQSTRDRSPVRPPPGVPMFTVHIYAVLDKKFKFNQDHDTLVL